VARTVLSASGFPNVTLEDSAITMGGGGGEGRSARGNVVTAGAALAHIDLALWLVRRRSPALARSVAHFLAFDGRPSQAAYVMQDHLAHSDPLVEKFESWARRNLSGFSLDAAARVVGASERTLERRAARRTRQISAFGSCKICASSKPCIACTRRLKASKRSRTPSLSRWGHIARGCCAKKGRGIRELRLVAKSVPGSRTMRGAEPPVRGTERALDERAARPNRRRTPTDGQGALAATRAGGALCRHRVIGPAAWRFGGVLRHLVGQHKSLPVGIKVSRLGVDAGWSSRPGAQTTPW